MIEKVEGVRELGGTILHNAQDILWTNIEKTFFLPSRFLIGFLRHSCEGNIKSSVWRGKQRETNQDVSTKSKCRKLRFELNHITKLWVLVFLMITFSKKYYRISILMRWIEMKMSNWCSMINKSLKLIQCNYS